jgi:O-acetyl-ADP-ribose deacetylase (regulator of RNase III)
MKLIYGDLFEQYRADAICITTNGFVKQNGRAVMGRGCAFEAVGRWPTIDKELGDSIKKHGNVPSLILNFVMEYYVLSFPVKHDYVICSETKDNIMKFKRKNHKVGSQVPGWAAMADVSLIKESAIKLVQLADKMDYKSVVIPRPGCGAGELNWDDVYLSISPILDDRFKVITFRK